MHTDPNRSDDHGHTGQRHGERGRIRSGSGFAAGQSVELRECGQTNWIAPQNPCSTGNTVTAIADGSGNFTVGLTAEVCPRPSPTPTPVTRGQCYVGAVKPSGIDTIALDPVVSLIVTYP